MIPTAIGVIRTAIEKKLDDALHELHLRARDATLPEIQRMYGVALGLRIALMELNGVEDRPRYETRGHEYFSKLLDDGFGKMTREQIRNYAFPEVK